PRFQPILSSSWCASDPLQGLFRVSQFHDGPVSRRRPPDRITDDELNFFLVIRGKGFMARPEVEDPPLAAGKTAAGPEHVPAGKPAYEYRGLRGRYVKALPIHLFMGDLAVRPQPVRNRVSGLHHPEPFLFSRLSPAQQAARP